MTSSRPSRPSLRHAKPPFRLPDPRRESTHQGANMKFGVGLPTATAGMMYPTPFASAADVVDIAVEAEQLGYYEVAGNDHITTQQYVRESYPVPPDFFEPLVTYGYI